MILAPPESVRKLQTALQAKAKGAPNYRFYLLYDKLYRKDVLTYAYQRTSTSVSSCCERPPVGWRPMRKPGSHCANKRPPFGTLRSARRCIRSRRFARLRAIFNKRLPNRTRFFSCRCSRGMPLRLMLRSELPTRADSGKHGQARPFRLRGGRLAKQGFEHQAAPGVILLPGLIGVVVLLIRA
jgi:hypothetical protein